jgi:chromate transport protein ChrA
MGDIVDAGSYVSIEVVVILALIVTYSAFKKSKENGFKVGGWAVVLVVVYALFPKLVGSLLTLLVCVFFLSMAFR